MPEEKKDSFTFSDKIKSSKPAGNKSFAKSSAKIGRDGKPKATLFERTRRDAPFFIAALVALLLLPFLYKYSGQASEDQFLTPSSESSNFDPERYGFDTAMIEDPDGQIAQLAGRDSLSLIKGWGNNQEEDYARDDMDLDASASYEGDSDASYAAQRHSSSEMDVEDNTTNIYKRRARAGTRAAFRRTKIGTLNGAVLRRPGGSRLGINHWGGGLKNAAKKVGSNPTGAPKPVSLQPLRAAGPARSSFGQGAAQAARKGLDNMGKANAVEALRDSYVKPVDPTRTAGVNLFSDGRSGGSGKLNHNINIGKGQTPWWWDMMKTRMQEEWMARFKRKWDWINWMDKLAQNILGQVANCLITGHSGGDVDHMLGDYGVNSSVEATCCGQKKDRWAGYTGNPDLPFDKNTCKGWQKSHKDTCPDGWKAATGGNNLNFFQQRLCCFGICNSGAYASGNLGLSSAGGMNCANMPDYNVVPSGQARKWNVYTYVVARNYFPDNLKNKFPGLPTSGKNLLCASTDRAHGGSSLNHEKITSGVGHVEQNAANQQILDQIKSSKRVSGEQQEIRERTLELDQESLKDACVVVVSQGNYLTYNAVRNAIIDRFKDLGKKAGKTVSEEEAVQAFNQLDLFFVSSFAAKDKLAYAKWFESGHSLKNLLPIPYWEFENAYIPHKKVTHKKDGSKDNVYKAKWRVEDQDMVRGEICFYENTLSVSCQDDPNNPQATVTFKSGYKGTDGKNIDPQKEAENLVVTAQFTPSNGAAGAELNMHNGIELAGAQGKTLTYMLNTGKIKEAAGKTMTGNNNGEFVGNVTWKVYRNARTQAQAHAAENANKTAVFTATCTLNLSGDGVQQSLPPTDPGCQDGEVKTQEVDRNGKKCTQTSTCNNKVYGPWVDDPNDPDCSAPGERLVNFYGRVNRIPCKDNNGAKVLDGNLRTMTSPADCLEWSACRLTVDDKKLFPLDEETKKYVKAAQAEFNNANKAKNIQLSYEENNLTIANLVDAIMINPKSYNGKVPKNTACLLGKSIGGNARDPQASQFDNIFGAFIAFIGYDAASFPAKWTTDCTTGTSVENLRFPCGLRNGKNYYWGGYVDYGDRSGYKKKVDAGPWKGFPLAALLRTPLPTKADGITLVEVNEEKSRKAFHDAYKDLETTEICNYGDATMNRDDVLKYIAILCDNGEQIKPEAWVRCDSKKVARNRGKYGNKDAGDCAGGDC